MGGKKRKKLAALRGPLSQTKPKESKAAKKRRRKLELESQQQQQQQQQQPPPREAVPAPDPALDLDDGASEDASMGPAKVVQRHEEIKEDDGQEERQVAKQNSCGPDDEDMAEEDKEDKEEEEEDDSEDVLQEVSKDLQGGFDSYDDVAGPPARSTASSSSSSSSSSPSQQEAGQAAGSRCFTCRDLFGPAQKAVELPGDSLFEWLIHPIKPSTFYKKHWEKEPLLVRRGDAGKDYYGGLFSKADVEQLLSAGPEPLRCGEDVDVTLYKHGERRDMMERGQPADPKEVWSLYGDKGCSVRLLRPQAQHRPLWQLLAKLEEHFRCGAGANTYLTPAGSQGFAPHYDDIEAFILQVEGAKRWRVYEPLDEERTLPSTSSEDFTQADLDRAKHKPVLDVVLKPGDLLYFPRGWVHQAESPPGHHSLHVTVSTAHHNTWGDYLRMVMPQAVEQAIAEVPELRQSMPRRYLDYMGVMHSETPEDEAAKAAAAAEEDEEDEDGKARKGGTSNVDEQAMAMGASGAGKTAEAAQGKKAEKTGAQLAAEAKDRERMRQRTKFASYFQEIARLIMMVAPLDSGADRMAQNVLHDRLPPVIPPRVQRQLYDNKGGKAAGGGGGGSDGEGNDEEATATTVNTKAGGGKSGGLGGKALLLQKVKASKRAARKAAKAAKKAGKAGKGGAGGAEAGLPLPRLTESSFVRLTSEGCARLAVAEDAVHVFTMMANTKRHHEVDPQIIDFDPDTGPAIEFIFRAFPRYVMVSDIPVTLMGLTKQERRDEQLRIATVLYENHVLVANLTGGGADGDEENE